MLLSRPMGEVSPSTELTNYGWRNTSFYEKFDPAEYLAELDSPIQTGRSLGPQIWQKIPVDHSAAVERIVLGKFKQEIGKEIDRPERFEINGRLSDYLKDKREQGNGQVIARISKQLYGNSALAREGSALQDLYRDFQERSIHNISLEDLINALSDDYNNYKNSIED